MRILVIGCGSIGTRHIRNLKSLGIAQIEAFDTSKECARNAADEFGIKIALDLEDALGRQPDAVLICVPNHLHLELAEQALNAGSHVFVEKPISHSIDNVTSFVDKAEQSGRIVLIGCNMRFHQPVCHIQRQLDENKIGRIQLIRMSYGNYLPNWRATDYRESYSSQSDMGGGIILDAIHELDLAAKWLGGVESVYCMADHIGDLDMNVEDSAEILLLSPNRGIAETHIDYLRPERVRTYEIIGSKGMITWTGRGKNPEHCIIQCYQRDTDSWETYEFEADLNEMYVNEMLHFLACIRGEEQPSMDARHGMEILSLALAAKQSADLHHEVSILLIRQ